MREEYALMAAKRPWIPEIVFAMFRWVIVYQPFRWIFTTPVRREPTTEQVAAAIELLRRLTIDDREQAIRRIWNFPPPPPRCAATSEGHACMMWEGHEPPHQWLPRDLPEALSPEPPREPGPERFQRKPVYVEAARWNPSPDGAINTTPWPPSWGDAPKDWKAGFANRVLVIARYGTMFPVVVREGDWVVRDAAGKFTACTAQAFAATYEPASPSSPPEPPRAALSLPSLTRHPR
jgi:hypothetical protein